MTNSKNNIWILALSILVLLCAILILSAVWGTPSFGEHFSPNYVRYRSLVLSQLRAPSGKEIGVYLPSASYTMVSNGTAKAQASGVSFCVDITPKFELTSDMTGDIKADMDRDYNRNISVIRKMELVDSSNICSERGVASATVCYVNSKLDTPSFCFATLYNVCFQGGLCARIRVEIDTALTDDKTALIVRELEDFYNFDIFYDAQLASDRIKEYKSKRSSVLFVSTNYVVFELPSHWSVDDSRTVYPETVYASGGEAMINTPFIVVSNGYHSLFDLNTDSFFPDDADGAVKRAYSRLFKTNKFGDKTTESVPDIPAGMTIKTTITSKLPDGTDICKITYMIYGKQSTLYFMTINTLDAAIEADEVLLRAVCTAQIT